MMTNKRGGKENNKTITKRRRKQRTKVFSKNTRKTARLRNVKKIPVKTSLKREKISGKKEEGERLLKTKKKGKAEKKDK